MLSSRFAGIPISSSLIDVAGVPQLLTCGEQTLRAKNPAQLSGFISEWCPASNRKPVRLQIGNSVRLASEFALTARFSEVLAAQITPGPRKICPKNLRKTNLWLSL
jgi:hypothetical protein